mmetsp:Transcript_48381/g.154521  ORF Transcript_48381/g.154521 Transcript_48381/m.154521 type:complete len:232 (+) Transcript_48381:679-1374(+)
MSQAPTRSQAAATAPLTSTFSCRARAGLRRKTSGRHSAARWTTTSGWKSSICAAGVPSTVRSQAMRQGECLGDRHRPRTSEEPSLKDLSTCRPSSPVAPVTRTRLFLGWTAPAAPARAWGKAGSPSVTMPLQPADSDEDTDRVEGADAMLATSEPKFQAGCDHAARATPGGSPWVGTSEGHGDAEPGALAGNKDAMSAAGGTLVVRAGAASAGARTSAGALQGRGVPVPQD